MGRAVPQCRHIGCVVSPGAATAAVVLCCVVLCCVVLSGIGFCLFDFCSLDHMMMTYVPCATMTLGGGGAMARYAMPWFSRQCVVCVDNA